MTGSAPFVQRAARRYKLAGIVGAGLLCAAAVFSVWALHPFGDAIAMTDGTRCAADRTLIEPGRDRHNDMVRLDGGTFAMGSNRFHPEEAPVHEVSVGPFWIDRYEVTNAEFAAFVEATGYVTVAERPADPVANSGIAPDLLVPGAIVFVAPQSVSNMVDIGQWWQYVPGADWQHPEGPGSSIEGRDFEPVVNVTRDDALAYARWLGRDLPTEAEWEFAARGGLDGAVYAWGNDATPNGEWQANAWQGVFPVINQVADGYEGRAPVGCFPANGYGLYDMTGNVWELTKDDYADAYGVAPGMVAIRGGSYLCADNFCYRYRPAARQPAAVDVGTTHIGFRTVLRIEG